MSSKVKCTCGWSWNKSDSSKKDMYICHECGRDNSNNMQNGGWLDSYDKAQDGIISPNVTAQDQYFEERNKEKEEYEKLIGNTGEELIDFGQRFIPGLRNFPAIGSTFAVGEAEANNQDASLSDELGMIPHPYTQAASLIALYAEKEKENFQKFAENKDRGKTYDELVREEEVNNKVIDNTYIPKPEIGELKGTKTKEKKIPYKEKKEVNEVQVDNTSTVKPRVDTNYKPKPKPKPKLVLPKISYKDNSFVMPKEINEVQIDNTYVAKPRLKNGGWLDNYGEQENYNDYKVSAPEGMVGDGFSNVGRNYSPAWGGSFQEGGEIPNAQKGKKVKPLYVESKNDPRYRAYQDSLSLYNQSIALKEKLKPYFNTDAIKNKDKVLNILDNSSVYRNYDKTKNKPTVSPINVSWSTGSPLLISASGRMTNNSNMPMASYPIYKKPQQPVIVKPKEVKPKEKLVPLQPMSIGLQDVDNRFETNLNIPIPPQKQPKYYNITDVNNQNFGGGSTSYRVDSLDELRELPKEQWDRKITPQYQMGGNVYPVNYIPQAKGGMSMPGSVGFTYARTQGIPSKGPHRNQTDVTDASAQNGQEMQYYREGLDWKPKSIGQNGLELPSVQSLIADTKNRKNQSKVKGKELKKNIVENTRVKNRNLEDELVKEQRTYVDQLGKQMAEEKRRAKLTQDQREREDYNAYNQERGSIEKYVPESTWNRTKAIVSNPLTAFGYAARNQSLPKNFQYGERNVLDNAIDWINPLQGAAALSEIPGELGRGEYLNAGLSTLDALDLGVYAKGAMKASKPFLQKAGQQLGKIPTSIAPELRQGLRTNGLSFDDLPEELQPSFSRIGDSQIGEYIPYQEDDYIKWFNEQKAKMNPPVVKQDPRSILRSSSIIDINDVPDNTFKSEIDWSKWNKEIPENTQLMDEYNAIEQTTKGNNTWMKNPDGSAFQGTPEQFIQQNSENFKNAFGNSKLVNADGSPKIIYHGTRNGNLVDNEFKAPSSISSDYRITNRNTVKDHNYFASNKEEAERYASGMPRNNPYFISDPKTYDIYANIENPYLAGDLEVMSAGTIPNISNYDAATNLDLGINTKNKFAEIAIPYWNKVKSATGNNGMFDMTNPNIYKSILPIGLGVGAASQMGEEEPLPEMRKGGVIKDDMGQWNHPGEITEINSPYITMQGVPYPVLGISDTGDMQMMYPEEEYEFDGEKVTEYPMAKNGKRQEQKSLQNLNNLVNFTNYNTKQPGGWLDSL